MMSTGSRLSEALRRLERTEEWPRFVADRDRPFVELTESIARFLPPFEYLSGVTVVFDPVKRFLLDRAIAGDAEAQSVIEDELAINRKLSLGDRHDFADLLPAFRVRHAKEIAEFERATYAWETGDRWAPVVRLSGVGKLLDERVLPVMGEFGFDLKRRRYDKKTWRCSGSIAGHSLEIVFEKDSVGTCLSGYLEITDLGFYEPLGSVFFYSGTRFPARERREQLEEHVSLFMNEYQRVFPFVASAVAQSLASAEVWWSLGLSRGPTGSGSGRCQA